jgi:hypothetical protein
MVLRLPEYMVRALLGRLQEGELLRLERFGDLDQVRFPQELTPSSVLERIYGG